MIPLKLPNKTSKLKLFFFISLFLLLGFKLFSYYCGGSVYYREIKEGYKYSAEQLMMEDFSDAHQFKDSLFIGDSFTVALDNYGFLEDSYFLALNGFTVFDHISYTNWPADLDPKSVFILLGINDLTENYSTQEYIDNYNKLLKLIKDFYPKAKVYVQSIAPVTASFESIYPDITNKQIDERNIELQKLCQKEKVIMLNPWNASKEENGTLTESLSSDGLHLSKEGHILWLQQLLLLLKKR